MSGSDLDPEGLADVLFPSVTDRVRFLKCRYLEYKAELRNGNPGAMEDHRARAIAHELSVRDYESLLGRAGLLGFRQQINFEKAHASACKGEEASELLGLLEPSEASRSATD